MKIRNSKNKRKFDKFVKFCFTFDMDIFAEKDIKSEILEILSMGPQKATDLVIEIQKDRRASKQAVYLALRILIKDEIVVKYRKKVMLNQIWINQLNEFVAKVDKNYLENYRQRQKNEFDELAQGDRIIYLFQTLTAFDTFWNHTFSMIVKKTNRFAPLYLYNPHEWTALAREKSEKYMYGWIGKNKPKTFYAIGGNDFLDQEIRKNYASEQIEFSIAEKMGFENYYYLAILENYLIETYLDKNVSDEIEKVYKQEKDEETASEKIKRIFKNKSKFKIVVSINSEKARRLKKKFEKVFFIPKEMRDL